MAEANNRAVSGPETPRDWNELCAEYEMARLDASIENEISDAEGELLYRAQTLAMDNLLNAPAPDAAALAYKLQVFRDEDAHELTTAPGFVNVLLADARRLAREGALAIIPTLQPAAGEIC